MWPRMDFLDLQQLDRWPNGWLKFPCLMMHYENAEVDNHIMHGQIDCISAL